MAEQEPAAEAPELTVSDKANAALEAAIEEHDPFKDRDEDEGAGDAKASGAVGDAGDDDDGDDADAGEDTEEGSEEDEEGEQAALEDEDNESDEGDAEENGATDEDEDEDEADEEAELHAAWTLLHKQGVPPSVLKNTPKAKLIAWAKRIEAGAKAKEAGATHSVADAADADGAKASGQPAQAQPSLDWASISKGIADELGIDESAAEKAFKPALEAVMRHAATELTGKVSHLEKLVQAQQEQAGRVAISEQLRRLEGAYPQLKGNKAKRDKLTEKVSTLAKTGGYTDLGEAFDDAAKLVFGSPKADRSQARRNGVSTSQRILGGNDRPAEDENSYFMRAMDLVESGQTERARALPPPRTQRKPGRR